MERRPTLRRSTRGVTLIEVLIASGILAIVSLATVSTLLAASRMSVSAQEDMMALEIVNRQVELVRSSGIYSNLGNPSPIPSGARNYVADEIIPSDPNFPSNGTDSSIIKNGVTFTVSYQWYGFGTISNASSNSISFDGTGWPDSLFPASGTPKFVGRMVILRQGNQMAKITNHTKSGNTHTFTIDYDLNDYGTSNWGTTPLVGEPFEVDGGKWVRVVVSWESFGKPRSVRRHLFVPWRTP